MLTRRVSTIKVDFSNLPTKPPPNEVIDFITAKLGLNVEQISRIHLRTSSTAAHVEIKDPNIALDIVEKHDGRHEMSCQDKLFPIVISMDDGSTIVKIHDASVYVTNTDIAEYMSNFGEVISVTEGIWSKAFACAGLPNGFRYVRMIIKKQIPSYIHINGETTLATYRGQQPTCRKCDNAVHHGMTCVQNRKLTIQKTSVNERLHTYASVTSAENRKSVTEQGKNHARNNEDLASTAQHPQEEKSNNGSSQPVYSNTNNRSLQGMPKTSSQQTTTTTPASDETTSTKRCRNTALSRPSRSLSAKRQAEKKLTDCVSIVMKKGRTRYTFPQTSQSESDKGKRESS